MLAAKRLQEAVKAFQKLKHDTTRPRLFSQGQGQGQDLHEVSSRILEAKARPRGQQDCGRGYALLLLLIRQLAN